LDAFISCESIAALVWAVAGSKPMLFELFANDLAYLFRFGLTERVRVVCNLAFHLTDGFFFNRKLGLVLSTLVGVGAFLKGGCDDFGFVRQFLFGRVRQNLIDAVFAVCLNSRHVATETAVTAGEFIDCVPLLSASIFLTPVIHLCPSLPQVAGERGYQD